MGRGRVELVVLRGAGVSFDLSFRAESSFRVRLADEERSRAEGEAMRGADAALEADEHAKRNMMRKATVEG